MDRHLLRVDVQPGRGFEPDAWPWTIPAIAQLLADGGLEVPPGVTLLVGENGSGKSTLVEALAAVYPRRGAVSDHVDAGPGGGPEDSQLRRHLRARTHPQASPAGFFLRAELMHGYLDAAAGAPGAERV